MEKVRMMNTKEKETTTNFTNEELLINRINELNCTSKEELEKYLEFLLLKQTRNSKKDAMLIDFQKIA